MYVERTDPADATLDPRTRALVRMTTAIEEAATLDDLLLLGTYELIALMDMTHGAIVLTAEDDTLGRIESTYPPRVVIPQPILSLGDVPLLQRVMLSRSIVEIEEITGLADPDTLHPWLREETITSLLMLPLVSQDMVIGAVLLGSNKHFQSPSDESTATARVLAGQLAAAITLFRTTEAAQERRHELDTISTIASTITSSLDSSEIYRVIVSKINEFFDVEAGSLLMRDQESGELEFVMTLEGDTGTLGGIRMPRGVGIVGYVAETQRIEIVNDVTRDPRFYRKISDNVGLPVRSLLCVPIVVKGRTTGVIELLNKRSGTFTEIDAQRLAHMAATIGVAIENARLFTESATVRERVESILNSVNDAILMADTHGFILTANPVATRLFRTRRDALIGRRLGDLLDDLRNAAIEISVPPWLNGESQYSDAFEMQFTDRNERFVLYASLPVRDAHGAVIGQMAIFRNTTAQRALEQLRDDYTGMLVHDLRAPLTSVMNGVMMVQRGLGGPISEQQRELLEIAHMSSQTMLDMINTLLDISRMEQGSVTPDLKPLSAYALADSALERLKASAQSKHVTLAQDLPLGLPLIDADEDKLTRVMQNLLDNAIKFSPSNGTVTLGVNVGIQRDLPARRFAAPVYDEANMALPVRLPSDLGAGQWLVFWVRDQGLGIAKQFHERIFEKFGQVQGRKVGGTGLGLTFCRLAVEAHHGRIWLESSEGRGSIFAFALPLIQVPARVNSAPPQPTAETVST